MNQTPKGLRLHIGLFGRRNAGKSSLVNALTGQTIAIVSDVPGTTTDPVEKACELSPIGPVVFIDTAGIDDVGELGAARTRRSLAVLDWMDIAVVVCDASGPAQHEERLIATAQSLGTPVLVVFNKADLAAPAPERIAELAARGLTVVAASAARGDGVAEVRAAIVKLAAERTEPDAPLVGDLVAAGDTALLVTPIDLGAPKGRLILPQVQAIRELLDAGAQCHVVKEDRVAQAIAEHKIPPALVITDSQAVHNVIRQTPDSIPVTTFSILMAAAKSDLVAMAQGAAALTRLKAGDRVLVCETCSHHPSADDIGRVKLPNWLQKHVGGGLQIEVAVGKDFPQDLSPYAVILQCGGCVVTRRHMLARLRAAQAQGVPMTNYGVAISYLQGVLPRALQCHPAARAAFDAACALTCAATEPT
ncbi:MAG: [FeFe] hydrogenase H-cluster maturation GTPase HydF [Burkholderiaceae bacterium]